MSLLSPSRRLPFASALARRHETPFVASPAATPVSETPATERARATVFARVASRAAVRAWTPSLVGALFVTVAIIATATLSLAAQHLFAVNPILVAQRAALNELRHRRGVADCSAAPLDAARMTWGELEAAVNVAVPAGVVDAVFAIDELTTFDSRVLWNETSGTFELPRGTGSGMPFICSAGFFLESIASNVGLLLLRALDSPRALVAAVLCIASAFFLRSRARDREDVEAVASHALEHVLKDMPPFSWPRLESALLLAARKGGALFSRGEKRVRAAIPAAVEIIRGDGRVAVTATAVRRVV